MDKIYLMIFALAIVDALLLIYGAMLFSSLNKRLDVLEKNFGESTLDCYDKEGR